MHDPFSNLKEFMFKLSSYPESELSYFISLLKVKVFGAKEMLLRQGDLATEIFFVSKGLLKTFFIDENGSEVTKGFIWENALAAPYVSILTSQASNLGITSLEKSEVISLPAKIFTSLYDRHSCWQEMGRKIAENLLIERERREKQMLLLDAEKRFESFLENFGPIIKRIPQYEIASYIGVTPVALSQIRSRRAKTGNIP